ncbi:MAG: TolC family protein [Pirellulaceae bacterium]
MPLHGSRFLFCLLIPVFAFAVGCRGSQQIRDPDYYELSAAISESWYDPVAVESAMDPVVPELSGSHPVEDYIQFGLAQNPQIQAARMFLESSAHRVPQAASLQGPTLGLAVYGEPVQTASGQQELGMTASQKLPWPGKLATRADVAEQEVEVARAELATAELEVIEKIKRAYYQIYYVQQATSITEDDKKELERIEGVVDIQFQVNRVSQQDLLRVQLELLELDTDLVRLGQQLDSAQASLAGLLHVSPETLLRALDQLPDESIPRNLEALYRRAIASRPELHAALAAIRRDQRASDLARLDYFPDVTLGLTWIDTSTAGISPITNGRDAFLLTTSVNLPIYFKRLEAGVREAETKAVASARQYDAVKDQTMQEVKDLFAQADSQEELLRLFRIDLIPKAQHTYEVSIEAYKVGQTDFLQMIDNFRELLSLKIGAELLEAQLRQSVASLARVVGSYELDAASLLLPLPPTEIDPPVVPEN